MKWFTSSRLIFHDVFHGSVLNVVQVMPLVSTVVFSPNQAAAVLKIYPWNPTGNQMFRRDWWKPYFSGKMPRRPHVFCCNFLGIKDDQPWGTYEGPVHRLPRLPASWCRSHLGQGSFRGTQDTAGVQGGVLQGLEREVIWSRGCLAHFCAPCVLFIDDGWWWLVPKWPFYFCPRTVGLRIAFGWWCMVVLSNLSMMHAACTKKKKQLALIFFLGVAQATNLPFIYIHLWFCLSKNHPVPQNLMVHPDFPCRSRAVPASWCHRATVGTDQRNAGWERSWGQRVGRISPNIWWAGYSSEPFFGVDYKQGKDSKDGLNQQTSTHIFNLRIYVIDQVQLTWVSQQDCQFDQHEKGLNRFEPAKTWFLNVFDLRRCR